MTAPTRHTLSGPAQLPMYDWPEIRDETDRLWLAVRQHLADQGFAAPADLDRERPVSDCWAAPDLVFSQTCGLPYVESLGDSVTLLGRPTYAAPGAGDGSYSSAIIVRYGDPMTSLADAAGRRVACNGPNSQSGWAALQALLPGGCSLRDYFGTVTISGGHRQSIQAVAAGDADIAAIDCVAWALALRYEPAARQVRTLTWSKPAPSLPYITAAARHPDEASILKSALRRAVATLPVTVRKALMLSTICDAAPADYACLRRSRAAA